MKTRMLLGAVVAPILALTACGHASRPEPTVVRAAAIESPTRVPPESTQPLKLYTHAVSQANLALIPAGHDTTYLARRWSDSLWVGELTATGPVDKTSFFQSIVPKHEGLAFYTADQGRDPIAVSLRYAERSESFSIRVLRNGAWSTVRTEYGGVSGIVNSPVGEPLVAYMYGGPDFSKITGEHVKILPEGARLVGAANLPDGSLLVVGTKHDDISGNNAVERPTVVQWTRTGKQTLKLPAAPNGVAAVPQYVAGARDRVFVFGHRVDQPDQPDGAMPYGAMYDGREWMALDMPEDLHAIRRAVVSPNGVVYALTDGQQGVWARETNGSWKLAELPISTKEGCSTEDILADARGIWVVATCPTPGDGGATVKNANSYYLFGTLSGPATPLQIKTPEDPMAGADY